MQQQGVISKYYPCPDPEELEAIHNSVLTCKGFIPENMLKGIISFRNLAQKAVSCVGFLLLASVFEGPGFQHAVLVVAGSRHILWRSDCISFSMEPPPVQCNDHSCDCRGDLFRLKDDHAVARILDLFVLRFKGSLRLLRARAIAVPKDETEIGKTCIALFLSIWVAGMLQVFKRHTARLKQIWGIKSEEEIIVQVICQQIQTVFAFATGLLGVVIASLFCIV